MILKQPPASLLTIYETSHSPSVCFFDAQPRAQRKIGKLSEQERYPVEPDSARSSASSFVTFDDDARMQTRALREELHEVRGMCQQILAQRSAE